MTRRFPSLRLAGGILVLALLTGAASAGRVLRPLSRDADSAQLAPLLTAARNLRVRGPLESGGLAVVKPFPVPVDEGLEPTIAPPVVWGISLASSATGIPDGRVARLLEGVVHFLASAVLAVAGARAFGAASGVAAGLTAWLAIASGAVSLAPLDDGLPAILFSSLLALACVEAVRGGRLLPFALGTLVALGGAFTPFLPLVAAAVWFLWGAVKGRPSLARALARGAWIVLVIALTWGVACWALGRVSGEKLRRFAMAPAPFVSWIGFHGAVVAIAVAVHRAGAAIPRLAWGAAAVLTLAGAFVAWRSPRTRAEGLDTIATLVRERVGFGEAFATNAADRAVLEVLTGRPVVPIDVFDRTVAFRVRQPRFPVSWYFLAAPSDPSDGDMADCRALAAQLKGSFSFEREGQVLAFDLRRALMEGAEPVRLTPGSLDAAFQSPTRLVVRLPAVVPNPVAWRIEAGRAPLETVAAVEGPFHAGESVELELDPLPWRTRGAFVRALGFDASQAVVAAYPEVFVRASPRPYLRSKTLLLVPLVAFVLGVAALLADAAFGKRTVKPS